MTEARSRSAKPKYVPVPRIWTAAMVAARFGKSEQWFFDHRNRLELYGFPKRDAVMDGWDSKLVDLWIDKRSGLFSQMFDKDNNDDIEQRALEMTRNYGENQTALR
jgi:hypothetical protein